MKTAIVFADGLKQIILTPENDDERMALKYITPSDNIQMAIKDGSFGHEHGTPYTAKIAECQGGYLRVFQDSQSIMLVLSPKKEEVKSPNLPKGPFGPVIPSTGEIAEIAGDYADIVTGKRVTDRDNYRDGISAGYQNGFIDALKRVGLWS